MKKQTVLSLLLIFTLFITAVPMTAFAAGAGVKIDDAFPDANFRAHVEKEIDTNGDGYLSTAEINNVLSLSVDYMDIRSLKGVELFTKMQELTCNNNLLTTLDVSKNVDLLKLSCLGNRLTAINLSQNTSLRKLFCDHNQLTTLDVSKNTQLTHLGCTSNKLTALNISKNTSLLYLGCVKNQLSTLNVSNNPELSILHCGDNKLTTLNLSKNTELTQLFCINNPIATLDLSKNTLLFHVEIPQKLNIIKDGNGACRLYLNQITSFVTLPSHYNLSQGTEVNGHFIKDIEKPWDNAQKFATFDTKTLVATWDKNTLGEYTHCSYGAWKKNDELTLRFHVTEDTELTTPVVAKGNDPSTGKPRLTWEKVEGATKYEVYRYDSVKKVYVKMYTTTGTTYTNTLSSEAGKTYYYKVKAIGSSSSMTPSITGPITITCKYPTPVVKGTNDPVTGRNVLNWKKVDGATKYEVYRYDKVKKVYVKMYTTTGTTYTNTIATVGETYFYKVKALGPVAAATSAFSKPVTLTYKCAAPVLTGSNAASTGKPKVSWGKIEGATKYEVYRYDKVKKVYVKMYTTTGTTYTNTIANAGETYFYKVKALGPVAAATSAFSKPVTLTYKYAAPVVKGSNDPVTGRNVLNWKKVDGATKYEVYRYDKVKKVYVKMYTTTGTTYTNTIATVGETYHYKVKALGPVAAATSAFSKPVTLTYKCATPVLTGSNAASTGKPKLTWRAVPGATKYEVYRYDSVKKDYVRYYITTSTEFINYSTQPGSVYYYKVKAIGATSESNSAMSSPVRIVCQ